MISNLMLNTSTVSAITLNDAADGGLTQKSLVRGLNVISFNVLSDLTVSPFSHDVSLNVGGVLGVKSISKKIVYNTGFIPVVNLPIIDVDITLSFEYVASDGTVSASDNVLRGVFNRSCNFNELVQDVIKFDLEYPCQTITTGISVISDVINIDTSIGDVRPLIIYEIWCE